MTWMFPLKVLLKSSVDLIKIVMHLKQYVTHLFIHLEYRMIRVVRHFLGNPSWPLVSESFHHIARFLIRFQPQSLPRLRGWCPITPAVEGTCKSQYILPSEKCLILTDPYPLWILNSSITLRILTYSKSNLTQPTLLKPYSTPSRCFPFPGKATTDDVIKLTRVLGLPGLQSSFARLNWGKPWRGLAANDGNI